MNWRLASRLSVITLAILVVLLVGLIERQQAVTPASSVAGSTGSSGLQGTDLGNQPAPDFHLTDQFGKQISLAQFKGQPVVLTFLYTHCPDVCPLTAEKLHSTMLDLGSNAHQVGILAVSTDPRRDDTAAATTFSKEHNMLDYWHFLIGSEKALSPVWSSYSIYAQQQQQTVNHSTAIYVIDKQGRERVYLGDDFQPAQLAADLKILMKE